MRTGDVRASGEKLVQRYDEGAYGGRAQRQPADQPAASWRTEVSRQQLRCRRLCGAALPASPSLKF